MNQRTLLAIGSIAVIVIGAVLILSTINISPAPPPQPTLAAPTAAAEIPNPEIPRVSLGNAKAAYELKSAVFVDVRDVQSYQASHIPGAVSIPLADLPNRLNELKSTDWIITYCT
jgi:3-mercaptopyruvate sulfurtransferase SseA